MGALDKEGQGPWDSVIELEPWRWGVLRRELHRDPSWKYLSPPTHSPGGGAFPPAEADPAGDNQCEPPRFPAWGPGLEGQRWRAGDPTCPSTPAPCRFWEP